MTSQQQQRLRQTGCDVRFDKLTRQLYATDASIYQIEPTAVAFPATTAQTAAVIAAAADERIAVTPRGAGTSLSGGAIGDGVVIDFSRHNRQIRDLDLERRTVGVGAGVVLDQLNSFLKPHGFCFGPDVATSSRATLGGMIANNSSGARVPVYGTTADHVLGLEIVLADGRVQNIDASSKALAAERRIIVNLVRARASEIAREMPPGLLKRWPGYGIERFLRAPNLTEILAGSEGTLAGIFSAQLRISPLPRQKGLGLLFFASVAEAMQATVELLDLQPAAIEHIDRPLLEQTKDQLHFQPARDLMELDSKPCDAILIVEFYDENVPERLAALAACRLGQRRKVVTEAAEMNLVWAVRKAGLSLVTGCIGAAKPVAFIEDAAVRPAQLPAYIQGLQSILKPLGLDASFYGHAATGLLHVRPVLDLHDREDLRKFREVADQTSALVKQFKGSLSAEHGVGVARTEYMAEQLGPDLLDVMKEIKNTFDPHNVFNPGKILSDGRHRIDNHLRQNFTEPIELPFAPRLAFAFKDRSFIGNLEQCNGCGGCRKDAPMMCPTFVATGEEVMSTRGRANIIRAAMQCRGNGGDPLLSAELDAALSNCLSCKGCTPECPSNVNLALLKAELMHAAHQRHGLPLRHRFLSHVDLLGRMGCLMPQLANALIEFAPARSLLAKPLGLSPKRSLPHYAHQRFDKWFSQHSSVAAVSDRRNSLAAEVRDRHDKDRTVILWDDTFVRYHEPNIGIAAVKVLEALGFEVTLLRGRTCCGRPAFSQGNLDYAASLGQDNVDLLLEGSGNDPIIFLEPSCWSMFVEDYRELKIAHVEEVVPRCFLFEKFVDDFLADNPGALPLRERPATVAIHAHCHAKSIIKTEFMVGLAERLPGRKAILLETGCCGMAGAFGMLESKYHLSLQVAADLLGQIDRTKPDVVVASGTSCRHQISDLSERQPKHMAELFAEALA